MTSNRQKSNLKCDNCGNNLVFSPDVQAIYCDNCKISRTIEKLPYYNHPLETAFENSQQVKNWQQDAKVFKCKNCGGNIIMHKNFHSDSCAYCQTPYVVQTKKLPGLLPDAIIPFKFDKETAAQLYVDGVKKKTFIPNKFKKSPPLEDINGFYMPVFSFDANSSNIYTATLGYNEKTVDINGRPIVNTTYKTVRGQKNIIHKNIKVESSSLLTQEQFEKIKPFNETEFVGFNEDYVRGFAVEYYDNGLKQCSEISHKLMQQEAKDIILSAYHYDFVQSFSVNSAYTNEEYCYQLLPVYKVSYNYNNKKYTSFLNGQTGKLGGGLPISKFKVAGFISLILFIIFLFFMLATFLH